MHRHATRYALFALALLAATGAKAAELTIDITDIKESTGFVMLALFDSDSAFDDGGKPVDAVKLAVDGDLVSARFADLATGRYAVKLYHDANGNGEMDTNMLGLPVEGYGFSNDAGRFGPPPFADAAFDVTADANNRISITVR